MSETRVVTPGNFADVFIGLVEGLVGSIDDDNLKGSTILSIFETPGGIFLTNLTAGIPFDFIGQQYLVGETNYFIKDVFNFNGNQWQWSSEFRGDDMQDAFNASETVTVIFDFRQEQYTTPQLVKPYGNQGTIVGDTVNIDLNDLSDKNFTVADTVTATNLPPGLSETDGVVTGTLTDNTGPFEVLVTATNSIGTTTTTFTWNTYRLNTNTRIVTPGNLADVVFGFSTGFIGSIDDDNLKGKTIVSLVESVGNFTVSLAPDGFIDFIGQQFLVGETTYFIKDVESFSGSQWLWPVALTGSDMVDGFNATTNVTVILNQNGVNTFLNSAINSDIKTPIPFPAYFDNR